MNSNRILLFDYIKGIACLIVANNHFFNIYKISPESKVFQLIVRFFTNGTYMVYIFLGISFYLVSLSYLNKDNFNYKETIIKRYLSLVLHIVLIYFIAFLINKMGGFLTYSSVIEITGGGDRAIEYPITDNIIKVIYTGIFKTLFSSTKNYVFPFWMIYQIFIGFLLCLVSSTLIKNESPSKAFLICTFIFIVILCNYNITYLLCPIMAFCAYLYTKIDFPKCLAIPFLIIGMMLSFSSLFFEKDLYLYSYICGSIFIVVGVCCLKKVYIPKFNFLYFIGELSLPIFVIHQPLTTSICAMLFIWLSKLGHLRYLYRIIIVFALYYLCLFFLGNIWNKLNKKLNNKILKFF